MSGWASLPRELTRQIVYLVIESSPELLCEYATISRDWQEYVEEKTFSKLKVRSTQVQDLRRIVTPRRQSHVCDMIFEVILPEYDAKAVAYLKETMAAKADNNRAFTNAIYELFDELTDWKRPEQQRGVSLDLWVDCPSDRAPCELGIVRRRRHRFNTSLLELLPEDGDRRLARLEIITEFSCGQYSQRSCTVAPKACCDMAAQMPNVHKLEWNLSDNDRRRNPRRRVKARQDLAAGLQTIPDSVRHFTFSYHRDGSDSHDWIPPRLYDGDDQTPDPLSVALRQLSQRLVTLRLGPAIVSPDVLWPLPLSSSPSTGSLEHGDHFPHLEVVYLLPAEVTPAGEWLLSGSPSDDDLIRMGRYSDGDDDDDDDDDDVEISFENDLGFRTQFNSSLAEPYFLAAATAAQRMPKLKELCLEWQLRPGVGLGYLIVEEKSSSPRAMLATWGSPPIELSHEAKQAWRKVTENLLGSPEMDFSARDDDGRDFHGW
ncbi:hypothetical protein PFICI_11925 [Pestalotiopsis fici W106-1]|uniref:F-box domain-containing protein n=1 Tax=Pestalotiopsis fici (strain W106-1 / CGMCC3.15140) TaxID=1229662 RepID=W3WRQ3_PESFW|nr:uncharacterized protein PFICI_11925 [Pestalotiopsis fici W106-1]ETS76538.1 hypothetical protein PFICI_11925 [Pestalotiopsis fici W106-1]